MMLYQIFDNLATNIFFFFEKKNHETSSLKGDFAWHAPSGLTANDLYEGIAFSQRESERGSFYGLKIFEWTIRVR